jgi:hypothetical protein
LKQTLKSRSDGAKSLAMSWPDVEKVEQVVAGLALVVVGGQDFVAALGQCQLVAAEHGAGGAEL